MPKPALVGPLLPPPHVAIIMDGNRRWALEHNLPKSKGHREGAEAARTAVESAIECGVSYLTLYGFSSENWKRPKSEISNLMGLIGLYLRQEVADLDRRGVRIRFIGERRNLSPDIVSLIDRAEKRTRGNAILTLIIALSYGSRQEIVQAVRRLACEVASGTLDPDEIDESEINRRLFTCDIPDPDLVIRTSGEQRISNFLLWQSAYAELVFVPTLWPDFSKTDFVDAISEYHRRERRFGMAGVR